MFDGTFPAVLLAYNRANTNSWTHHAACKKPLHIVMLEGTFLLYSSRTHTSQPMQQQHSTALYTLCMGPMSYQIGCKPCDGPEPSSKCLRRQTNIPQAQRCTITWCRNLVLVGPPPRASTSSSYSVGVEDYHFWSTLVCLHTIPSICACHDIQTPTSNFVLYFILL